MQIVEDEDLYGQASAAREPVLIEDVIQTAPDERRVVRVTPVHPTARKALYGSLAGKIWISDDFDEPLEEFEESANAPLDPTEG